MCAFRRGWEERQFLYVVYFVLFIVVVIATVSSTDLLPFTKGRMSDLLLRRSLLLHRGAVLAWKRRRRLYNTLLLQ